jgi:PAS domain S-box-containing protein
MNHLSTEKINQILSLSPAIIYSCRATGDFAATFVSGNITSIFGYSIRECLETPNFWRDNIHPDDVERVLAVYDLFFKEGHHVHEYRFRKKDGSYSWILDQLRLIRDADGNPLEMIGSWLDITDRKETEEALKKSLNLFREFFMANPVGTIITTPPGQVLEVNPAFIEASGYSAAEVVGRTSQELGFWRNLEDRERMVSAISQHGFIDHLESVFFGKNGKQMTCLVSSRAIQYEGEVRILSIVIDVTDQRRAEEAMRKLDKAKSDFISTAAHELRTPLVSIVGYCELLENADSMGFSDEQREHYLSVIQSNAGILNRLIDDLLDLGRIQVGRSLGVSPKENDLLEIVDKVVASFGVKTGRHEIVVERSNDFPQIVWLDAGRIAQVLYNLLNNAIKYSPEGGIVRVRLSDGPDKISVSIADQGVGMTAEQMEHVFERFYRVDPNSLETVGLGLGMSIVKQIIDDHGGSINVSSQPGEGTTVTFELPVRS